MVHSWYKNLRNKIYKTRVACFKKVIITIVYNIKKQNVRLAARKQLGWFKDHWEVARSAVRKIKWAHSILYKPALPELMFSK